MVDAIRLNLTLGHLLAAPDTELPAPHTPRYFARFVRAGPVRASGNVATNIIVTPDAIQRAATAGLFDNKAVFVDHAAWLENASLTRLIGRTGRASFNTLDQSVEGDIELFDTPAACLASSIIAELLADPTAAPDIGLSLVFYPVWQHNEEMGEHLIAEIRHIESIDLVFQPAADGRILAALSSQTIANTLEHFTLQENPHMTEPIPTPAAEPVAPAWEPAAPDGWAAAAAQSATAAILAASGLPEPARTRLAAEHFTTPEQLHAAIEAERAYLAALHETAVVQIGGQPPRSPHITSMRTSLDQITLALDALIAGTRPADGIQPLTGLRELYHLLSGDYEMTGLFQSDRVTFANVNSSTLANMVANVLNKRVAQEFINYPMWWTPVVLEEDFQSLQAIKWITLGGIGELPTVAEGAAYTELNWDDSAETASFVKKGGYLGITIEAIDKDDTARLRNAPRALAQAAWLTLSKAISAVFTTASGVGPTLADGKALFHTDHANLATSALSIASYNAARTAMRKQTELNSGERLGALTSPKFLLVPPDLEITALQVLASDYDYTYALSNAQAAPVNANAQGDTFTQRMNAARSRVIVVDLWTDTNDWAACADPRLFPTIGVGYRYGRNPEIFSVASPTAGLMFTNDTMPIKARFFFAVAPIDHRGLYKANVA